MAENIEPVSSGLLKTKMFGVAAIVMLLVFSFFPSFGNPFTNLRSLAHKDDIASTEDLIKDPRFSEFFGENLEKYAQLDTDSDGTPDVIDKDIDSDGVNNDKDSDEDGDGIRNGLDPSTALTNLARQSGLDGSDGSGGTNGSNGSGDTNGTNGSSGTVGVVTDDGVIQTSLTGSDLDIGLLLAVGSGLEKNNGLTLKTNCLDGQLLKWVGDAWACGSDSSGIVYAGGSGIDITGSVITSTLGESITSSEITNSTIKKADVSDDTLDFDVFVDAMTLDAKTSLSTTDSNYLELSRVAEGRFLSFADGTDTHSYMSGQGTPEGSMTADTGSLYVDTTNGALYIKDDDGDATGWSQVGGVIPDASHYTTDGSGSSRKVLVGYVDIDDIGAGTTATVGGDLSSATKTNGSGISTITVNFPDLGHTNYSVQITTESQGTIGLDNDIYPPVVDTKTSSSFEIYAEELASVVQDLVFGVQITEY